MKLIALLAAFLVVGSAMTTQPCSPDNSPQYADPNPVYRAATVDANGEQANRAMADQLYRDVLGINADKIQQCSCDQVEACGVSAMSAQLDLCRTSCLSNLDYFINEQDGFVNSAAQLAKLPTTERILQECMSDSSEAVGRLSACYQEHVPNHCVNTADGLGRVAYMDRGAAATSPMRDSPQDNPTFPEYKIKAGLTVTKAQNFYTNFRSFQVCVNRCVQRNMEACFATADCAAAIPRDSGLIAKVEQCATAQSAESAKSACSCMQTKLAIRKWIGVCPLLASKPLMAPKEI